jgi:putative membrane protein (TIGR04086 family)
VKADTTAAEPAKFSQIAMTVLAGMIVGIATSLIILLIFSFVMTVKDVPQGAVPTLTAVSVALGSFAGGFAGAKLHRKAGLATGAATGLFIYLLLLLAGTAMQKSSLGAAVLIKFTVSLASGGIGGIMGVNTRKAQKF